MWNSRDPEKASVFKDPKRWAAFLALLAKPPYAGGYGYDPWVKPWVDKHLPVIEEQFAAMPYWPHTASPIESEQTKVGRGSTAGRSRSPTSGGPTAYSTS